MPPLPSNASIWYCPSSTVSTIDAGSASNTSPSIEQKLTLSSYFALQAVQYFIEDPQIAQITPSLANLCNLWIDLAGVFLDHAVAVVLRGEGLNGALHHRDPLARNTGLVTLVIQRHHFQLERAIKRLRIERVDLRNVSAIVSTANREPVHPVISFHPPTVEDRKIQPAINRDLLTARS